ncbi:UTP--glucose-1-phosphate uridylyltransferase [Legionella taurinensis]|uniref:UTP--glucose-1-phosphate uridylyltransferase n=1 Tax=Legionella taurinensis TaxID=70611 RepID=A0A3A5L7Y2_9GAMM|nr:UTP--glucose-1-phosphate uridylyltransferase GalU [Legionella taurinensis]MDX1836646.1 UTP--glucose-1-phosphate uridylyltransferase GalU [Legionella taurinensis]PUT42898.1 UTP--glucose-1-phosphate uridylyltransferase [Legionella taurinensis]PUT45453.1 UTP--glucose-1-phosphate uridylyltransferase [Legionella taurinensis]PUT46972.1 UTP--glucose-1-phosphate uridylyltransferase [Legionella taurinensis]PUT49220.1 UTP--glucose-1-phosphate uridylyltransferase [Legionella taurinensis]
MQITKAVFPVAGLGSRFLPATKANPKEMLPIVDKPLIQYAVEEAVRAGITHMIFITSAGKRSIEDHFDNQFELESRLQEQGRDHLLSLVKNVSPEGIHFTYVRQNQPLGLGHAVLCAEHVVGNEPFAVLLADDLIDDARLPCLAAMTEYFDSANHSLLAVQPVPWEDVHQYGVVEVDNREADYSQIKAIIEKPQREAATSNLAAVGRYVFTPGIFSCLKETKPDHRGEIQLTDAIQRLLSRESVSVFQFRGRRYDCGSKLGYIQATVELGLKHPEIGESFRHYLQTLGCGTR